MSDLSANWPEKPLRDLFDLARQHVMPRAYPTEEFAHFSIPVWDEKRGPAIELGASIGSAKIAITQPTVLVSKLNPRIARVAHLENPSGLRHCASTEFMPYVARSESVVLRFYRWFFESQLFQRRLESIATGSTNSHKRARPEETLGWNIPSPSPDEQKSVAGVLDTMNEAITKTEAVVEKLRHVRAGLLRDLLTRGLNAHGQLRDPIAHPEQFQDSPFGLIPKEWDLVRIADEAEIQHGYAFDGRHFTDKPLGPRLLVPGNFHRDGGLYFTDETTKYYAGGYPEETVLSNRDILIVMTDLSPLTLILGRTVLLDEPFSLLHNQRIGKFRLKRPKDWNPTFFVAVMNDDRLRRKVIRDATGTTVRHTSPDRIRSGFAFKPKPDEQDRVVARLNEMDSAIAATTSQAAKFYSLKSGLMTDLLTGRVRVPKIK